MLSGVKLVSNVNQESLSIRIFYGTAIVIPLMKSIVINHTKSSESIEKDAAILLLQSSVESLSFEVYIVCW